MNDRRQERLRRVVVEHLGDPEQEGGDQDEEVERRVGGDHRRGIGHDVGTGQCVRRGP